jgi:hypothetical protein
MEAGLVTSSQSARSGRTAGTSAAMGGPGWLYGQARNWATRDASTPAPRTWTGGAAGGGGNRARPGPGSSSGGPAGQWAGARAASGAAKTVRPQATATRLADPPGGAVAATSTPGGAGAGSGRRRIGDRSTAGGDG